MASFCDEDELSALPREKCIALKECTTPDSVEDAREAEQQTAGLKLISKKTYNETVRTRFKWMDSRQYLLDKWLEEVGQKLLVDLDDNKELEASVLEFVRSLSDHMRNKEYIPASTEVKFDAKILGIGSYYSRTKKYPADEFDFLFEYKLRTDPPASAKYRDHSLFQTRFLSDLRCKQPGTESRRVEESFSKRLDECA